VSESERSIQHDIRLGLGMLDGVVLWRNTVGVAMLADGSMVRFGLAVGSSDLVGLVDGRFAALEVKSARGKPSSEQTRFMNLVRKVGGFACVVRSLEEARAAVGRCREGKKE